MRKIIVIVCMLFTFTITTSAQDAIDFTHKGSINLTLKDPKTNQMIDSGKFTLYHVADIRWNGNGYEYAYTVAFSNETEKLENLQSTTLITSLVNYAHMNHVTGTTADVSKGNVSYTNLAPGLYLIVNSKNMTGYNQVNSFLISVPNNTNGTYIYDVNGTPKLSITSEPNQPVPPVIPVTGVLWWPVPVLSVLGILLISIGTIRKYKYEKTN